MSIKIDKNVPIPEPHRDGYSGKYPWPCMEVGDSFLAPMHSTHKLLYKSASRYRSMYSRTFHIAIRRELETDRLRVWRIS